MLLSNIDSSEERVSETVEIRCEESVHNRLSAEEPWTNIDSAAPVPNISDMVELIG
jgi:hypothetical protein